MLNALFAGSPSGEILEDAVNYIKAFYHGCGVNYDEASDKPMIESTLISARQSIRQLDRPSPFKKAAVFTHFFIYQCPVTKELPDRVYPKEVTRRFYHNAILAVDMSLIALHGAKIGNEGDRTLENKIRLSRHQHQDIMVALCQIKELKDAYTRLIAIIYETLAYEFNANIRYSHEDPL